MTPGKAQSIRRSPRRERWTTINNRLIEDASLGPMALAILVYLLSKPDDWVVMVADLERRFRCKEYKVRAGLANLKQAGYLSLETVRTDVGTFGGRRYVISEDATETVESPVSDKPRSRINSDVGETPIVGEISPLLNTEYGIPTTTEEDQTGVAAPNPPPPAPPSDPLATPHVNGTAPAADPTPPADAWAPFYAAVSETLGGLPVVSAKTGKPLAWAGQLAGIAGKHVNGSGAAGAAVLWREFTASRDWQYAGKPSNYPSAFGKWVGGRKGAPAAAESSLYAIADARTYRGAPVPDGEIAF